MSEKIRTLLTNVCFFCQRRARWHRLEAHDAALTLALLHVEQATTALHTAVKQVLCGEYSCLSRTLRLPGRGAKSKNPAPRDFQQLG